MFLKTKQQLIDAAHSIENEFDCGVIWSVHYGFSDDSKKKEQSR